MSVPPGLRVLIVCLGNICRSPTAEAVLRVRLCEAGLEGRVEVDSAGTGGWHIGMPPDARSQRHAKLRGYDLSKLRGRQISDIDFNRFDLVLAMDDDNLVDLEQMKPPNTHAEVRLFAAQAVPDPYHGPAAGFEHVLDLIERASEAWVPVLQARVTKRAPAGT